MKVFFIFAAVLTLAFLLFLHNLRGLSTEKVLKEGAAYQEVHIVWDWNKMVEWARRHKPFTRFEEEKKEREKAVRELRLNER